MDNEITSESSLTAQSPPTRTDTMRNDDNAPNNVSHETSSVTNNDQIQQNNNNNNNTPSPASTAPTNLNNINNNSNCSDVTMASASAATQHHHPEKAQFPRRRAHPNYITGEQTHSTIAELSEAFRMFTNVNGIVPQSVISHKDLMKVMEQTGMRATDKDVAAQIQVVDQNQSGSISFDEFASLMGRTVPIEEVDTLQAAFAGIDKNQTGVVSAAQFAELMVTCGEQCSPEEVSEMLAFADPNGTGKVNYRVFLRMLGLRLR